jgi:hypothetical protein
MGPTTFDHSHSREQYRMTDLHVSTAALRKTMNLLRRHDFRPHDRTRVKQ